MSSLDLSGWRTTTAIALTSILPLQTFESSLVLVESYLATTGGWVPDSPTNPTGPGQPVTGETPEQGAISIKNQQYARIYTVKAKANLRLDFTYVANLAPGQSNEDVLVAIQNGVQEFLETQLGRTSLTLDTVVNLTGEISTNGQTTSSQRLSIFEEESQGILNDPRAIALHMAKNTYGLDDLWNVESTYTEPNGKIVVIMAKYTELSFGTLDIDVLQRYVISVNPGQYLVETGLFITPAQ